MRSRLSHARRATSAVEVADDLRREGRLFEAIDVLVAANREAPDGEIERKLVRLRHDAFPLIDHRGAPKEWPPPVVEDYPHAGDPPEVVSADLTVELLRHGILRHGCVLVRGLVPPERVERLVDDVERAFQGFDAHQAGTPVSQTTPYYEPFKAPSNPSAGVRRVFDRQGCGVHAGDSPRGLFDLLDTIESVGLGRLIEGYLGERPAISWNKTLLRRVDIRGDADWHQDGAFLGKGIRSVNVWIALSHCGDVAPGLDLVPCRLDEVISTGTNGASFSWSAAPAEVREALAGRDIWRPIFEPGDVLLFDHMLMHRTAWSPEMTEPRYATESWFFAPSAYPDKRLPLAY